MTERQWQHYLRVREAAPELLAALDAVLQGVALCHIERDARVKALALLERLKP
jgi:hypothetical protein